MFVTFEEPSFDLISLYLLYLVFTSLYLDPFYELMKLAVVKFFGIIDCTID